MTLSYENEMKVADIIRGKWHDFLEASIGIERFDSAADLFKSHLSSHGIKCEELSDKEAYLKRIDTGAVLIYLFPVDYHGPDAPFKDTYAIVPNELAMKILALGFPK